MIDIEKAKKVFDEYISKYDLNNNKIIRKVKHTYRVTDISNLIAEGIGLDEEDIKLATLIGLLHDIGRFEQIKRYNTFADKDSIDHGELGIKILFEENLIREVVEETKYDNIIKVAVFNHNKFKIQNGLEGKELLHSKIVRDADKLDDLYLGTGKNNTFNSDEKITDKVFHDFINNECIFNDDRVTEVDKEISYLAWIYDINFDYSLKYIKDKDYINQIINNISLENEDAINKMKTIRKTVNDFLNRR